MIEIPLQEHFIEYQTDLGVALRVGRAYVKADYLDSAGNLVGYDTFLDCAAPFSIIPFRLWHDLDIARRPLGQLLRSGKPDPAALQWFGVPCELAEVQVSLRHSTRPIRTRLLPVVAKLPTTRVPPDNAVILGYNFLVDNSIRLTMEGVAGRMVGSLVIA